MAPSEHTKNPERVAAGLKASIKNPNVSEEAKVHASERLQELSSEKPQQQQAKASHHRAEPEHGVNIESSRVLGECFSFSLETISQTGI
ncbi:hypothetical protein H0H81_000040 [Sphagnurus paluster]|uniref:Conidiation-specific protein 6 n=1 Tax=Sphagnurus paluster TaxID=117069 RepID=A0A9P7G2N3_9AGAR|nr:hypothetical protein H0H81_000040 [Sphagnurus paluster]